MYASVLNPSFVAAHTCCVSWQQLSESDGLLGRCGGFDGSGAQDMANHVLRHSTLAPLPRPAVGAAAGSQVRTACAATAAAAWAGGARGVLSKGGLVVAAAAMLSAHTECP